MAAPAKHIDWERVKAVYCAGFISIGDLAKQCGLTDGAIYKRAKRGGWKRNLVSEVEIRRGQKVIMALAETAAEANERRKQISQELSEATGNQDGPRVREWTDEQAIELAALTQVAVIRGHHKAIRKGHDLTQRLFSELEATTSHLDELEDMIGAIEDDPRRRAAAMRAISLPARAGVMRDLAQATKILISLERQAVGLDERGGPKIQEDTDLDSLLAEIRSDAERLGLKLIEGRIDEDDQGVANRTLAPPAETD